MTDVAVSHAAEDLAKRGLDVDPRVIIVADSASARFGGEAILPLQYFRILRRRGIPVWLVVHERTRDELATEFGVDDHIRYIPDTRWHVLAWRWGRHLPDRVSNFTLGMTMRFLTQVAQKAVLRELIRDHGANLVHQPTPVSPKEPSLLHGLGVPVVIGPMNGGMSYPPAFRDMQGSLEALTIGVGRALSSFVNRLLPGKRVAALLLVANQRTRNALPDSATDRVVELVENGVDLALWEGSTAKREAQEQTQVNFVFMGRLIALKMADLLIRAFAAASKQSPMCLLIAGDGTERPALETLARSLGVYGDEPHELGKVCFAGWRSQHECTAILRRSDALVLPSVHECGGAVVLEAMAMGLPVIATNWGGPADYVDASSGVLVEPTSREALLEALTAAMVRLAGSPQERQSMGEQGRRKVVEQYDWEVKVDRILQIYRGVLNRARGPDPGLTPQENSAS